MPRPCSICTHPERAAIDRALASGTPKSETSALFRVSPDAVDRHFAAHLPARLVKAAAAQGTRQALDVLAQLKTINSAALQILVDAEQAKDPDTALKAIDRIHRQIELQAKLLGELDERPQFNVLVASEWLQVRAVLLKTLSPYPEAKIAVAANLMALEAAQ